MRALYVSMIVVGYLACMAWLAGCAHPWVQTHPLMPNETYRCGADGIEVAPRDISRDGRHMVREPDGSVALCEYVHRVPKGMPVL